MATTLYFRYEAATTSLGSGHARRDTGGAGSWAVPRALSTTAGTAGQSVIANTTAGTSGIEFGVGSGIGPLQSWLSEPLASAVTISGTISFKMCGYESDMKANAAFGVYLEKVTPTNLSITGFCDSIDDAEMSSTLADHTWTTTPSSTSFAKGDRIRICPYIDDAPGLTMAATYNCTLYFAGSDADGYDSYVQFNETLSFMTFSGAQYLYPTNTASDVSTADVDYKIWTSRGT